MKNVNGAPMRMYMREYIPGAEPEPDGGVREIPPSHAEIDPEHPHIHRIITDLLRLHCEGYDVHDPEIARHAVRQAEREAKREASFQEAIEQALGTTVPGQYVYYMQIRDTIKIGFSKNPERRKRQLAADRILAVEPGSLELESRRHGQFGHLRIHHLGYERYGTGEDLLDHIAHVWELHGKCWLGD